MKPNKQELFNHGYLKTGQVCRIKNKPKTEAKIISARTVLYKNEEMSFNAWLKQVTGWPAVSFFSNCEIVGDDTVENIRCRYLGIGPEKKRVYRRKT